MDWFNQSFGGETVGRRLPSLGELRSKREDNIKMDPEKRRGRTCCINLVRNVDMWRAVVNTLMKLRVP
jgi:hypothetical protein